LSQIENHLAKRWIKAGETSKTRAELERALVINDEFTDHAEAINLSKQLCS
jgi:hypothetical protein